MLNQQQFSGVNWGHYEHPAAPEPEVHEPTAHEQRLGRQRQAHERWKSYKGRNDTDLEPEDMGPPHPRTGLPSLGPISTHEGGVGFGHGYTPIGVSYHDQGPAVWRRMGKVQWVPTPNLRTPQDVLSGARLHEAIEHPETRSNPRFHGVEPQLPRVYHDTMHDSYVTVDGNHRLSADYLQGRMFSQARVITDKQLPEARKFGNRMNAMKKMKWETVDPYFVESRIQRLRTGAV